MADFISKHLPVILIGTGVAAASATVGYVIGTKQSKKEKEGVSFKSYFNENDPLMAYILENSLREPAFLSDLREETRAKTRDEIKMIVDPLEAQFIRLLLSLYGAKR